ncbi:glycine cleavage system aminomethyltransferase GcvT [Psychroflexus montanilacus]|uniref:glycine cleavage system aminomethyltransferase GcvT n=1 Tax=Psychroflexus montanilacus TaxID=2873598 RepID=UPI001CCEA291|nr:glycine cleavage system aminomethyltransferase GcvT [Psychroflexus montanilacus]MBZ9650841.1 glycine cleavage system aminomethyltransferase GcvT [Psychroflexus montanilacus]
MKSTALNHIHHQLGAKMVPFAGYEMPVSYKGVNEEHETVRQHLGVFDVSHMGEFFVEGKQALDLIQKVTTNDASKLVDGQAQYTCMPNSTGGIVDDLIIYKFHDEKFMMVVNASNIEKDWEWINSHNSFDAKLSDLSDDYSLLAIQGPKAVEAMQSISPLDLTAIKFYHFEVGEFAGAQDVIISATGYTGSGGFEIYFKNKDAEHIWTAVLEAGKDFGIQPIGLAARDTLRLEMGMCLYGNDIDETTSPIEAKLGWITKFTKDFINAEALKEEKEKGPSRKLVAFEVIEKGIPRHGYDLLTTEGDNIGHVTSGTMSPSLKKAIGMGYVKTEYAKFGTEILIQIRKKQIKAVIVKPPFYKA